MLQIDPGPNETWSHGQPQNDRYGRALGTFRLVTLLRGRKDEESTTKTKPAKQNSTTYTAALPCTPANAHVCLSGRCTKKLERPNPLLQGPRMTHPSSSKSSLARCLLSHDSSGSGAALASLARASWFGPTCILRGGGAVWRGVVCGVWCVLCCGVWCSCRCRHFGTKSNPAFQMAGSYIFQPRLFFTVVTVQVLT